MANRFWVGGSSAWNGTALLKWSTTSGGVGGAAVPTAADDVFFDAASGAVTVNPAAGGGLCRNLDFTGFTGTLSGVIGVTVSGSLTWSAAMSQLHTGPFTFNATAAGQTITSNGKGFGGAVTFNGVGGAWQLQDAASIAGAITLTNGAVDTNAKNLTCGSFSLSGVAVRSLNMANSQVTVGSNVNFSAATNFTLSAAGSSLVFAHTVNATNTFQAGGLTYGDVTFGGNAAGSLTVSGVLTVRDFLITNTGAASFVSSTTLTIQRDFLFTGYTGALTGSGGIISIGRHLQLAAGMTAPSISGLTFTATSGTNTITSNGVALNSAIVFDGVGGTWQLQDALSTSRGVTLTNGTLDTNGKAVASSRLYAINSNARTLQIANTTWTVNAPNISVWDLTGANLTFSAAGSLIRVDNSASALGEVQDFNQGALTYNDLAFVGTGPGGLSLRSAPAGATFNSFTNSSSGRTLSILGDNTFAIVTLANPHAWTLAAGTTQTIGALSLSGAAGNPLTIRSTIPGTQARLVVPKNNVAGDYIDAQDCVATGGARWFAGRHGVNSGNTNGWRFTDAAPRPQVVRFAA